MGTVANIQIEPCSVTWGATDLGFTEGDIEVSLAENLVDITAHQTGTDVLGQFRTGKSVEVTVSFKETTRSKLETLLVAGGGTHTPGAGTEVSGWGSSKQFQSTIADADTLVLHPLTKASNDKSEDYTFWLAYPILDSITLSAENPSVVSVTFKCYRDDTKQAAINYFCKGDGSQDLDA